MPLFSSAAHLRRSSHRRTESLLFQLEDRARLGYLLLLPTADSALTTDFHTRQSTAPTKQEEWLLK